MVLHHELTVPVGRLHHSGKLKVHMPVRKIVHCRTHDLQQSLMCKLGRATQNFQATEGALLVRSIREEAPFEVVSAMLTLPHAGLTSAQSLVGLRCDCMTAISEVLICSASVTLYT